MRCLLLIHGDERVWEALPEEDRVATVAEFAATAERLREAGKLVAAEPLEPTAKATTVRVRDADVVVSDGPYAETKEQLGGYFLLDADSLEEAVELARALPLRRGGGVEVRPAYTEGEEER